MGNNNGAENWLYIVKIYMVRIGKLHTIIEFFCNKNKVATSMKFINGMFDYHKIGCN